ncbi:FRG domain-containing protein [Desulfosporosinus meridiei]|uniref:FRG domain protein n=1 Tax=Desulfosporosinus meridiei (strain ATCC BAA-275 / DSM 13257 / KCTC 12902 / NCIMB 13706 / S10) TaxID=768704 RepID=J7IU09_DESMD|nr:FRG domain-containing protein [Desulfosporosinus meridiei]AFQ42608.1 FRG domain protein [Desulfosporosinus meridiei DSM 13257]
MILTRDYITGNLSEGVITADLSSWEEYADLVTGRLLNTANYIWRGQRSPEWLLESTLDRLLKKYDKMDSLRQLKSFRYGIKGRRELNAEKTQADDDWWASGLHYSLVTPLLEWTTSPFIAAYFAFREKGDGQDRRAIYSFAQRAVIIKNKELKMKNPNANEDDLCVKYLKPLRENNSRLANRSSLFTKSPIGVDLEQWVRGNFGGSKAKIVLVKLTLPNNQRTSILKAIHKMNLHELKFHTDLRKQKNTD